MRWLLTFLAFLACLLTATAHAATVNLSWTASGTAGVTGYRIYYGTATATYTANIDAGLSTSGTIGSLTAGETYFIAVKAYNATAQESAFSNEISVEITVDPPNPNAPLEAVIMPRVHSR